MAAKRYEVLAVKPPPSNSDELQGAVRGYVTDGYSLAQIVLDRQAPGGPTLYVVRVAD